MLTICGLPRILVGAFLVTKWLKLSIQIWLETLTIRLTRRLTTNIARSKLAWTWLTKVASLLALRGPTLVVGLLSSSSPGLAVSVCVTLIWCRRLQGRLAVSLPCILLSFSIRSRPLYLLCRCPLLLVPSWKVVSSRPVEWW